jgi:hypothetical protein
MLAVFASFTDVVHMYSNQVNVMHRLIGRRVTLRGRLGAERPGVPNSTLTAWPGWQVCCLNCELRIGQRSWSWRWHVPLRPVCVLEVAVLVVAQER